MALSLLRSSWVKVRLPSVELGRWSLWLSYVGDEGGVVPAGNVGPWSLWMLVLLQACLCAAVMRGLEPSSKNPPGNPVKGTARPVVSGGRPREP